MQRLVRVVPHARLALSVRQLHTHAAWPPALLVPVQPEAPHSAFHEEFGRFVTNAAVCSAVSARSVGAVPTLPQTLLSEATARTLALALPLDNASARDEATALYAYVGHVATQCGLSEAVAWVTALYRPFLAGAGRGAAAAAAVRHEPQAVVRPAHTPPAGSAAVIASAPQSALHARAHELAGPNISSVEPADDGMNLFDAESWLTESPTAQRLWRQGD